MKKFKIATLGCRTNQYESQSYHDQLLAMGYTQASDGEKADICIVNTCTVTESADSSSRHAIRELARNHPDTQLVVTGCFAEREPQLIKEIGGVTAVISNKDKENLLNIIFPEEDIPEFSIKNFDAHTRAFVKVQDGCNSFCTYCIIPYVRGRSRSKPIPEIVREVEGLIENGFQEIVLTGINIGDFDGGAKHTLAELVRIIDAIPGLKRLRVSSIDPDEVNDDLTDAILNGKNTCHSMHLVLQSGSNVILKRMNRKYTRHIFLETVERLTRLSPRFTVTTDIIVGFPGETDLDFQDTLDVMREVKFAKVHMFPYSDRERTKANLMPNKVPPQLMKERKQKVLELAEQHSFELRKRFLNQTMSVLTESSSDHETTGHTENFLPVIIPKKIPSNTMVNVTLVENTPAGLIGKIA